MATPEVILVHGLFHQPAHLQALVDALRRMGVTVHTPRLHRGSLEADTAAVQAVVDQCDSASMVVGHSYGGAVIAGVHGAESFLFMAAFVPDVGESCAALGGSEALVNAWVRPHPDGGSFIPADAATELFYADCRPADAERAVALLVPQASGHGRGIVRQAAWKQVPSHYVVCTADRAMNPKLQHRLAARCTSSQVIDASHSPYISQPELLAGIIVSAGVPASDRSPGEG